jgi:hypothetical protein
MARAPLFRGNHLRMALLRFRYAYIIVAVLRSTALRRVVDGSLDHHRHRHGDTSSSLHPDVNTVRPHPSGSGRSVLTSGPHRLLRNDQAPHLWCVASKRQSKGPSCGRLTGRSTSSPGLCRPPFLAFQPRSRLALKFEMEIRCLDSVTLSEATHFQYTGETHSVVAIAVWTDGCRLATGCHCPGITCCQRVPRSVTIQISS